MLIIVSIQAVLIDPLISNSSLLPDMNYIEKWMVDPNKSNALSLFPKFEYLSGLN